MRTQLGPFQVLEVVGRGGMGTVYRGLDPIIGRPVAIKVIRLVGYNDGDEQRWLRDRLFSEARAAGNLCHPGIVTIYQVGEENDVAYVAMEFVDGPSLLDILRKEEPLNEAKLCQILIEAAAALDYAHEHGLVHRDIKPANIMVNAAGTTKVTDFGIAKTMLGQTMTKTGVMIGTPHYMSPEQIRGKTLNGRSDQFSLAIVAYEVFTGRKPFAAEQVTSIVYQILHEDPIRPDDINPALAPAIANVVRRGLAKQPESRYRTCSEFATALAAAAHSRVAGPVPGSAPEVLSVPRLPVGRRTRWLWPAVLGSLAIMWIVLASTLALTRERLQGWGELSPRAIVPMSQSPEITAAERPSHTAPTPVVEPRPVPERNDTETPAPISVARRPVKRTSAHSVQARTTREQAASRKAMLVWTGHAGRGDLVTISKTHVSKGFLAGVCPDAPLAVKIYPASWTHDHLTVFTAEPRHVIALLRATPRGAATFTFDPRHVTDLTLLEAPSLQNGWARLVIRVNAPLTAFVVECHSEQ